MRKDLTYSLRIHYILRKSAPGRLGGIGKRCAFFTLRVVRIHDRKENENRMNSISDLVLTYTIGLLTPYIGLLPGFLILIIVWRLGRMSMRGITEQNYRSEVDEKIADTIVEQLTDRILKPLLEQEGIQLPPGSTAFNLLGRLIQDNPNDLHQLTIIYKSLEDLGVHSPYFAQILEFLGLG